jgi:hypothetical protein
VLVPAADRALARPPARRLAAVAAAVALVAVGAASVLGLAPPDPRPADAPAGEFSAQRAHRHVSVIGARTHVAGSAANDAVREHLAGTLRGLGLGVAVQDTTAQEAGALSGAAGATALAHVRNVVATLPGSDPTGRVILVAHYDSVQVGPGANDDGAGAATMLEVARALTSGPAPRNDIVFAFTDAEEACLCGAAAFVEANAAAAEDSVVLNLEARGSGGPVIMFETSRRNAALVDAFGRAAPYPVGTSFAVEIYRRLPNDTDLTAFLAAGFAGMNSAYIDGSHVYHTPLDTPGSMDRASLQHHGDNALALAREFGATDLGDLSAGGDATYFPVPGALVRYPGWLTVPLAVVALLVAGALAWLARRRGLLTWPRLAAGFALGLVPLLLAPLAATALWWAITAIRPEYAAMLDPYRPTPYRLAALAAAAAVLFGWYAVSRRRVGPAALAVGALGWVAAIGLLLAVAVPGGAYLATLPALAGGLAGIAALGFRQGRGVGLRVPQPGQRQPSREWGAVAALTAAAAVSVLVLLPAAVLLFPALGMGMAGAAAFVVTLLGLATLPVVDLLFPPAGGQRGLVALRARRAGALPAGLALLATVVAAGAGLRVDRFDAAHPVPTHLMYALDADTGTARWLSEETDPVPWTAPYVPDEADGEELRRLFPPIAPTADVDLREGPAEAAPLPPPDVTVLSDTAAGDVRRTRLRVRPARTVRVVGLYVEAGSATVDEATVAGRRVEVDPPETGPWSLALIFHAPPAAGIEVELALRPPRQDGDGTVRLRVLDGSDGLGGVPGFRPRPPDVGIAGDHTSELVLVARTVALPPPGVSSP